jgi:hypothetical protein
MKCTAPAVLQRDLENLLAGVIGNEAVNIIENHDTAKPLFLYVASHWRGDRAARRMRQIFLCGNDHGEAVA